MMIDQLCLRYKTFLEKILSRLLNEEIEFYKNIINECTSIISNNGV